MSLPTGGQGKDRNLLFVQHFFLCQNQAYLNFKVAAGIVVNDHLIMVSVDNYLV